MTPEQRLDRAERIILLLAKAGYRSRRELRNQLREQRREQHEQAREAQEQQREHREQSREQNEKINILIQTHMETEEIMKRVAVTHAELAEAHKELAETQKELTEAQKLTDRALRNFINSLREGRNGKSSN